jgi:Icc-related predicted phosphoesterase
MGARHYSGAAAHGPERVAQAARATPATPAAQAVQETMTLPGTLAGAAETAETKEDAVRVAAVGDFHARETSGGAYRDLLAQICAEADVLALCGDLTEHGLPREAEVLAEDLLTCKMPIVAVLGNHDYESGQHAEVTRVLAHAGVSVLDGDATELLGIGFAGIKGFCGGFGPYVVQPWGEDIMKRFVQEAADESLRLESALARLETARKVVVLHFAPIRETVEGEHPEIITYLGCSRLVEPIERIGAAAIVHGHAHHGVPEGRTASGVPVYNTALPLLRHLRPERPYALLQL